jgi:hypothetical protein
MISGVNASAETEPNNNYNNANTIGFDSPVAGTISQSGDVDWFTLTTNVIGDLKVTQTEWPPFIETRITIHGPNNSSLAQNNPVTSAAPGTYYIKVWSANEGSSTTPYKFSAALKQAATGNDIDGGKDSASGAVPITIGTAVSDTIAPSKETAGKQDVDWYTLTTDVIGDLTVTQTEWPPFIETRIAIYGPNDPALAQNNPVKNAAPGTYYIKVWSANDGSSIDPYKFNVEGKQSTTTPPIPTPTTPVTATPCFDFGISGGTCIFSNGNIGGVSNNPTSPPIFTLTNTYQIISITNYHWNSAKGASPGTIGLKDSTGKTYGPWSVTTRSGQGGVPNAYWDAKPNIVLGPGTYTVIDSDTSTWSHNSESKNVGMSIIKGTLISSTTSLTPPCNISWVEVSPGPSTAPGGVHAGPLVAPGSYNVWTSSGTLVPEQTNQSGVVSISEDDVSLAIYEDPTSGTAVVYYRNDATISETWYAITVCPLTPTPTPPCNISWVEVSPGPSFAPGGVHAGPLVAPGSYNVWTSPGTLVPNAEQTNQSGVVSISEDDVSLAIYEDPTSGTAVVYYRNDATISETWYAITVCPATPAGSCDWSGTWQTNWGEMVLSQAGTQVNGTYTHDAGRITGTLSGSTLIGTWSEAPSYSPRNDAGDMQLTIAADCNSFTGTWRYGSSGDWSGDWTGTRTGAAPTTTPTPTP